MINSSQNLPTMLPPTPVEHVPSIVTIQNPQGVNFQNGHNTQTLLTGSVNEESTPTCGSVSSVSDNEEQNVPPLTCVSDKTYSNTTNAVPLNGKTSPSLPQSNDEEDLNDIFDDDFFQLLSDDPVASGFNEQETSSMPIHSSTSTFEPSMNQQQLPKIRSENVEESQVLAYPHSVTPNIAAISVSSSKDNEESTTEAECNNKRKRKTLTAKQKADGRRERNREHAKRSRKRKKVFVETLQEMIVQLKSENEKMRTCMTQHFGSSFVQDLLSSTGGAPASVSPVIQTLSTQSYSAGLDVICPKLTLSDSSSSIQRDATTVIPQVTPNGNGAFSPIPCSTTSSTMSTSTTHTMANAKWLAEEKTPKHLRRKNIMYKDKLNVLLPKQNTLSIIAATNMTNSKQQHPMVSKNSTSSCTSGHTSTADGIANTCNIVANPILM